MEFIISYILIAIIFCMLTGSLFYLLFAVLTVFIGFVVLTGVFFLFSVTRLIRAKRRTGDFVRVDTVKEGSLKIGKKIKYKVAVYKIDDKEYEAAFPAEGLFNVYFYPKKQNCRLWLHEKSEKVFDAYNVVSCIVWPVFCALFLAGAVYLLVFLIKIRYML